MRRFIFQLSFSFLAVSLMVVGCASASAPPAPSAPAAEVKATSASLRAAPISGKAAAKPLTIYGSGFVPGEAVKVVLTIEGVSLGLGDSGVALVNKYGAFVVKPDGFPVGVEPGVYTLEAVGDKGSRAAAPLEILK